MKLDIKSPKKSLNKAYLKEKVGRADIELFKKNLSNLFDRINEEESEEHLKNLVSDFLKDTWYKDLYEINTKGRQDLVIHSGKTSKEPVGVILEVKRPSNKIEMMSESKPNTKAMHELILYYLRERIDLKNIDIKYLAVTNIFEWYILDEVWFEKNIFRNGKLKKAYEAWKLSGKDTRFFYENIASPFLDDVSEDVPCTFLDLRDFYLPAISKTGKDDIKLIALYKILSPAHLLKQAFSNDSNSLDTKFYAELLNIIGLEEVKEGSKKLIKRKEKSEEASLLENTIIKLEDKDCLRNLGNLTAFGSSKKEQLFNIALELCITWVNRLLFLKLLEAQLYKYHKGDKAYLFLNTRTIMDYDELNNLFFQALAERRSNRREHLKAKFDKVPYLNSSLFERTELEHKTIDIGGLDNRLLLPMYAGTVLKDNLGKRRTGKLQTLQYFFEFLDSYDFTSEGSEEIQEENKNLINASVLGLIFEKINGYKDGSFFTPGFITMYMCKDTIRRAVIQKFNDNYKIECESIDDLKNYVGGRFKTKEVLEFNSVFNELKICDPAVGSGHFLVSALNELITIKAELGILADKEGSRLVAHEVKIENDELIVTYNDDTEIFAYTVTGNSVNKETQRIQRTLFHEKESLIENCLFGVDINPNSVKICRLRLWIELLKNAYYSEESRFTELETLPNIDINIKCGNSLISRFSMDSDLTLALKKNKSSIADYRQAVRNYHNAETKEQKRSMEKLIEDIKGNYRTEIAIHDPKVLRRNSLMSALQNLNYSELIELSTVEKKVRKQKQEKLEKQISEITLEIEEIKSNKFYENSLEWRFEFPEVLNSEGKFIGFDVVLGNPPYLQIASTDAVNVGLKKYLIHRYHSSMGRLNTYGFFSVLGIGLLKNHGHLSFIVPNTLLMQDYYEELRRIILAECQIKALVLFEDLPFQEAVVENVILSVEKSSHEKDRTSNINVIKVNAQLDFQLINVISQPAVEKNHNATFNVNFSDRATELLQKIKSEAKPLKEWTEINQAIALKHDRDKWVFEEKKDASYKPLLVGGKNIGRYSIEWDGSFLKYDLSGIHSCKREDIFLSKEKLLFRRVSDKLIATLDTNQFYALHTIVVVNNKKGSPWNLRYILALLNSKLMNWYYRQVFASTKTVFTEIGARQVETLPIKIINEETQGTFITAVNTILADKERQPNSDVHRLEAEIDQWVYKLYGLTLEEIKTIEG